MSLAQLEIDYSGWHSPDVNQQHIGETGNQRLVRLFKRAGQNVLRATEVVGEQAWGLTRKLGRLALRHRVGLSGLATAITGTAAVSMAVKSSFDINLYSTYRELFGVMTDQSPANITSSDIGLEMTVGNASAASSAVLGIGYLTLSRLRDIDHRPPRHSLDNNGGIDTLYAIMDDQRDDDFSDNW